MLVWFKPKFILGVFWILLGRFNVVCKTASYTSILKPKAKRSLYITSWVTFYSFMRKIIDLYSTGRHVGLRYNTSITVSLYWSVLKPFNYSMHFFWINIYLTTWWKPSKNYDWNKVITSVSYQFTILKKLKNFKTILENLSPNWTQKTKQKQKNNIFILAQIQLVMFNDKHNQDKTCLLGLNITQKTVKKQQEIMT